MLVLIYLELSLEVNLVPAVTQSHEGGASSNPMPMQSPTEVSVARDDSTGLSALFQNFLYVMMPQRNNFSLLSSSGSSIPVVVRVLLLCLEAPIIDHVSGLEYSALA